MGLKLGPRNEKILMVERADEKQEAVTSLGPVHTSNFT